MTFIIVTHQEIDNKGRSTGNVKDTLHKTPAVNRLDIDQWVAGWAEGWRYAAASEIDNATAQYFNPYVGEVNESTWN
jgi:hypothetical protein